MIRLLNQPWKPFCSLAAFFSDLTCNCDELIAYLRPSATRWPALLINSFAASIVDEKGIKREKETRGGERKGRKWVSLLEECLSLREFYIAALAYRSCGRKKGTPKRGEGSLGSGGQAKCVGVNRRKREREREQCKKSNWGRRNIKVKNNQKKSSGTRPTAVGSQWGDTTD